MASPDLLSQIQSSGAKGLRHVKTEEKNNLPTPEDIKKEKTSA